MSELERIVLARAEQQVRSLSPHSPDRDTWAVPWRPAPSPPPAPRGASFRCLGCGFRPVARWRSWCKLCSERRRRGDPCDLDSFLSKVEMRHLRRVVPGTFMVTGRPPLEPRAA